MTISLRWLGNAGFDLRCCSTRILVDPFLTRPHAWQTYAGRVAPDETAIHQYVDACQAILVSHAHFDHFMDVPTIAERCRAEVYGSGNTCTLAGLLGVSPDRVHSVAAGDIFEVGCLQVEVLPARHPWIPGYGNGRLKPRLKPPLHLPDYRMDACYSFLIRSKDHSVLVWSSTHTDDALPADILICRAVSDTRWYRRILAQVNPKIVIPSHWEDMFQPLSQPPRPFFSPPRLALPPFQRINTAHFTQTITSIDPRCLILLPQRFEWVDLP